MSYANRSFSGRRIPDGLVRRVRNPISPEYRDELRTTGVAVPLDVHPAFHGSLMRVLDALERSDDSVVAFLVATGRFDGALVFPDLETAARVRTAAAYLAGDNSQDMILRVRALDLIRLIEEATKIEKIAMRYEPSPPPPTAVGATGLVPYYGGDLLPRPSPKQRRRAVRLLADSHGDYMKGLISKFPTTFKKGYGVGWSEYETGELDEEAGDRWGQHINGLENGLWQYAMLLEKAGFETQVYDVCGCGDPLHLATVFRRPGNEAVWGVQVWDGLWHDDGSYDLNEDFCVELAEGSAVIPDDGWTAFELPEMTDEEWEGIVEGMFNPPPSRLPRFRPRRVRPFV